MVIMGGPVIAVSPIRPIRLQDCSQHRTWEERSLNGQMPYLLAKDIPPLQRHFMLIDFSVNL